MKSVVITQPRYIPILSYIQRLYQADLFIVLDDVQRQSRAFENRNKILLDGRPTWLTIPISSSSRALISESEIANLEWIGHHRDQLRRAYSNHPHYDGKILDMFYDKLDTVVEKFNFDYTEVTLHLLELTCNLLGFEVELLKSSSLSVDAKGPHKIVNLCKKVGATHYICGHPAKDYGVEDVFGGTEIGLIYHDAETPPHSQHNMENFVPWMGFYDILFNIGVENVKRLIEV
tara:strand:- start:99483 stop:100178 length:696 start_codon:yes stop_codon:yes gene_type:complete